MVTLVESVVVHGGDRIEVNFHHKEEMEEILEQGRSQGQDESPGEGGSHD